MSAYYMQTLENLCRCQPYLKFIFGLREQIDEFGLRIALHCCHHPWDWWSHILFVLFHSIERFSVDFDSVFGYAITICNLLCIFLHFLLLSVIHFNAIIDFGKRCTYIFHFRSSHSFVCICFEFDCVFHSWWGCVYRYVFCNSYRLFCLFSFRCCVLMNVSAQNKLLFPPWKLQISVNGKFCLTFNRSMKRCWRNTRRYW